MITGSLLLILVAAALVVVGLIQASDALLFGAIAVCALAVVLVYVGSRRSVLAAAPPASDEERPADDVRSIEQFVSAEGTSVPRARVASQVLDEVDGEKPRRKPAVTPSGHLGGSTFRGAGNQAVLSAPDDEPESDADSRQEPPAQPVTQAAAARLARLAVEVLVIDGRPRYHLDSCSHLADRDSESLPVSEAQALGFSPCDHCKPVTALAGSC